MILSILQLISCVALTVMAIRWHLALVKQESGYRFLFPYTVTAGFLGIVLVGPFAMEIFVACYSGAQFEIEATSYRLNGPYRWVYGAGLALPLLPVLGLFPAIGKRPIMMSVLGIFAAVPVVFAMIGGLFA